ncbi:MAG: error-prone DNA polymerase [Acidobacteria bacterium]|nr:error-prone DNA polymerase [Acidobacteriota bacterium]
MEYVELHCRSAFSFLEGASLPEELAERAAHLGYSALALLDRDGVYGAPRFYRAACTLGVRPLVGSELTLEGGSRLPVLVENRGGYQNLCRLITRTKLRAKKGQGEATLQELEEHARGLVCLTGSEHGPLSSALQRGGMEEARRCLERLVAIFGPSNLFVEVQRHLNREEEARNQAMADLAASLKLPLLASNDVRHSEPSGRQLLDVLTCIRHKTTLDRAGKLLAENEERYLKGPEEMARLFPDWPQAVACAGALAQRLAFTLEDLGYRFPEFPVPAGETQISYLRELTEEGARERYRPYHERAQRQIQRELDLIEKLDLAGYFLIVWDIVCFCRKAGILVQGRGSAANSAVCYSLGITAVDPVGMDLLFERFLSEERGEWPDIDLDLPSGDRREQVIQHLYRRYGKLGAAMTANVITYRGRSAAREVGKALGLPADMLDRLSKLLNNWGYGTGEALWKHLTEAGFDSSHPLLQKFAGLWTAIQDLPRHLGQHSGGMVLCRGRLDSIVPLENATMPGRVVVQWDKDDCADLGIIKVDLLGLGMMSVLQDAMAMIRDSGGEVDLAHLPPDDPQVYAMLQQADTIGVFQVESRAQMATLPRLKPERFYDLVAEVAIIRPGPIVGDMVHPYLNRRAGRELVTYPHPSLEPILARTLGVPLFQEQLLRMAMAAAGFTGGEAEELRRAFGHKRSEKRMQAVELKLRAGMEWNGITGEAAETIVRSITSFALYGFPESHAASFALLAYASAYLKAHSPAPFYAALLNNQPMGFYHPATLIKDAQRHGLRVRPIDVQHSDWLCTIENEGSIRLGLMYVRGLREETGLRSQRERRHMPFLSVEDLERRVDLRKDELTTLAEIGALNGLGLKRREALWQVERACRRAGPLLETAEGSPEPSPLKEMTWEERLMADYRGTGMTVGPHPMALRREEWSRQGILRATDLTAASHGQRLRVAGHVIVRQRPDTAKGFVFLTLEDETGIVNAILRPDLFDRRRTVLVHEPFLMIDGIVQKQDGVVSIRAEEVTALPVLQFSPPSHDFR